MNLFIRAFENTYGSAYDINSPFWSILSALTGAAYKYKRVDSKGQLLSVYALKQLSDEEYENTKVISYLDTNISKGIEQILLPFRLAKNLAKLCTEYLWDAASIYFQEAAIDTQARIEALATDASLELRIKYSQLEDLTPGRRKLLLGFYHVAKVVYQLVTALAWGIGKLGQTVTSPIAAMEETFAAVSGENPTPLRRSAAVLLAGLRLLLSFAAYASVAVFILPSAAISLAVSDDLGLQIVAGLANVVSYIGSLPLVTALGNAFIALVSPLAALGGLFIPEGAGVLAGAVIASAAVVTPVRAAIHAFFELFTPSLKAAPATQTTHITPHLETPSVIDPNSTDQSLSLEAKLRAAATAKTAQQEAEKREKIIGELNQRFTSAEEKIQELEKTFTTTEEKIRELEKTFPTIENNLTAETPTTTPLAQNNLVSSSSSSSFSPNSPRAQTESKKREEDEEHKRPPTPLSYASVLSRGLNKPS